MIRRWVTAGLLLTAAFTAHAQGPAGAPDYPQDYFRCPLDIPVFLAGNFGECRPGHFHSGADIKTKGVENQLVHVAADGYISRIKMAKNGFGHALYVTHPNGYTTLYAHLNHFVPAIQQYMEREQYKQHRWDVDLTVPPGQFPLKKGQLIAYSGNTGSSTAPHLHFEIRNTKTEHPLNPELFNLPLKDSRPPVATELAIYDGNKSIYMQDPRLIALHRNGDYYTPAHDTVSLNTSLAGIALNVDDYMEGSDNTLAFYTAKVFMDDALQSQVVLDDIGYDETSYINAYADYKTHKQLGRWMQCFFLLPGNKLTSIYHNLNDQHGALLLSDGRVHKVRIEVTDDKNNTSVVHFFLMGSAAAERSIPEGTLMQVNKPNTFSNEHVALSLKDDALFDDIDFQYAAIPYANALSDKYKIGDAYLPVHGSYILSIRPHEITPASLHDKVAMLYSDGKEVAGTAATITADGWCKATVGNFGTYWLAADTQPPAIKCFQKNGSNLAKAKQITFEAKDAMTSVKSFEGLLDGQWIAVEQHNDLFFYKFDAHCPRGKHTLVFTATDENNNKQTFRLTFTR